MALGIFKKIGNFVKKVGGGIKKVCQKVLPFVKQLAPMLTPILSATPLAPIVPFINPALSIADKVVNNDVRGGASDAMAFAKRSGVNIPGMDLLNSRIRLKT